MRDANTALAASLFLSDTTSTTTQEAGDPMDTSPSQVVAGTDSVSSSSSPPKSPSTQLRTALANDAVAAAAASQQHDAEVDAFLACLSIDTTTMTTTTEGARTPNEGNSGGAAVGIRPGREESTRIARPKRKRAADMFDLSDEEKKEEGGDEKRAKHA